MGHFCGALAGFLVGLVLLENRKVVTSSGAQLLRVSVLQVEMWEVKLKVVSVCIYISLLLGAILWHLVGPCATIILLIVNLSETSKLGSRIWRRKYYSICLMFINI